MTGRDPHEHHRTATPLELLYDLTFVVAFGAAANEAAHFAAEGHWRTALVGFGFAMFAVIWAWIQNTWFASAYDTDDWIYRLMTLVQMIGVLVLALGLPVMYESIDHGVEVDNGVMVLGYVIMRVGLIALWIRAARQDPPRRRSALTYVTTLTAGADRLDRAPGRRYVDRRDVLRRRRAHPHRTGRPVHRRDPSRGHALARPPHRRALRAAGDHHPRRGHPRHRRRPRRRRAGRRMDDADGPRRARRRGPRLRDVVDVLRHPVRRPPRTASAAVRSAGATDTSRSSPHSPRRVPGSTSPPSPSRARATSAWWPSSRRPPCLSPCSCCACTGCTACSPGRSTRSTSGCSRARPSCIVGAIVLAAIDAPLAGCLLVLTAAPAVTVVGYERVGHRHGAELMARSGADQQAE